MLSNKQTVKAVIFSVLGLLLVGGLAALFYFTSPGFLATLLASPDVQRRRWGADQLVSAGESSGKATLKIALDPAADPESRRLAIFVLGEIKYKEAIPDLLAFFNGNTTTLREQAAYALGRMGERSVASDLIKGYETAPKGVRIKIIAALGELSEGEGLLKKEAETNPDEGIRSAAEYALSRVKK